MRHGDRAKLNDYNRLGHGMGIELVKSMYTANQEAL